MDPFSSYNQVRMHAPDEDKTPFITNRVSYCYKVMPLWLKNIGAMQQHLVNQFFKEQIGKTIEAYIDDMPTKSINVLDHVVHLRLTFMYRRSTE